ncbi:Sec-independent protein translocase subunit TatA [Corynebacterium glutamicum]|uniref:Sec-independent protein translocase subunit TatA n=1 Tax=Corynebacterium glutamicum TaxID=1718 RepID=UPI0009430121|nr:Sec-independent protein translocase subunit TatA [Corynebacterium glutamicum]OKX85681.1 Sec-independent protein translocase TatA [Corynebacterium glutamicum]QDX75623.1 preprotein translocase subunit TatA [Corynebacterium glutamicum]QDX78394.1 preprotein translocase subunit TatA [Corynebacterium glutamicum]QYR16346.1 Sec-independent protein translocase subunit TatA [Corynebacterium glutamicum]TWS31341.1 preprotein translocase subunit TatA [Corynebacterium glutamicum]
MPTLGPWEIGIIVLLIILLFGAKKLPDAARSIGRSMRIFKSEVKEMNKDGDTPEQQQQPQQQQIAPNQIEVPQPVQQPVQQPNFEQHYQGQQVQQPQNPQTPDYRQNYEDPNRTS